MPRPANMNRSGYELIAANIRAKKSQIEKLHAEIESLEALLTLCRVADEKTNPPLPGMHKEKK